MNNNDKDALLKAREILMRTPILPSKESMILNELIDINRNHEEQSKIQQEENQSTKKHNKISTTLAIISILISIAAIVISILT